MNPNWDLSYLYKGFDDPAFLADLKRCLLYTSPSPRDS